MLPGVATRNSKASVATRSVRSLSKRSTRGVPLSGWAVVFKTIGAGFQTQWCEFESCHPCHFLSPYTRRMCHKGSTPFLTGKSLRKLKTVFQIEIKIPWETRKIRWWNMGFKPQLKSINLQDGLWQVPLKVIERLTGQKTRLTTEGQKQIPPK